MSRTFCIYGAGGFGREVLCAHLDLEFSAGCAEPKAVFMVDDEHYTPEVMGFPVIRRSEFQPDAYEVVIAVGDPTARERLARGLPEGTKFTTLIHPTAVVSQWVELGEGCVVTAGCIVTCGIRIGRHAHLNLHTTVGHDTVIGDFFTPAPGAKVSGNCTIGDRVYIGTNASVRERVSIADDVVIGLGAGVVSGLTHAGTYVGVPARLLAAP